MDLSIENQWEILEATFIKRNENRELTDKITIHIYDDGRDLFLAIDTDGEELLEKVADIVNQELPIEAMEKNSKEPSTHYFSISTNPSQDTMRNALRSVIPKVESIGLKLRKLEDTWV